MSGDSKIWFKRWSWRPLNRSGWVFYFIAGPIFLGLFLLTEPLVLGEPSWKAEAAFWSLVLLALALNVFVWKRSR